MLKHFEYLSNSAWLIWSMCALKIQYFLLLSPEVVSDPSEMRTMKDLFRLVLKSQCLSQKMWLMMIRLVWKPLFTYCPWEVETLLSKTDTSGHCHCNILLLTEKKVPIFTHPHIFLLSTLGHLFFPISQDRICGITFQSSKDAVQVFEDEILTYYWKCGIPAVTLGSDKYKFCVLLLTFNL